VRSIQQRLLTLILTIFFLVMVLISTFLWWRSSSEIHQVFDADLSQIAKLIGVIALHEEEERDLSDLVKDLHARGYEFPIIFQAWSEDNELLLYGPGAPHHPLTHRTTEGFSDIKLEGQIWRVYTLSYPGHVRLVHVAHSYSVRHDLIQEFAKNTLLPILLLTPFLGLLGFAIKRGLAPLHWLAQQISNRDQGNLDPLPTKQVPSEVTVMVDEINALFIRLKKAMGRYSNFTYNVAHELRNPISGIIAQAHSALHATEEAPRRHSLSQVIKGSNRLSHIVDQLLTLANIHPDAFRDRFSLIDLHAITVETMSELTPEAIKKGLEIELIGKQPLAIQGDQELTSILLSNLLRNAIQATPAPGNISVTLQQGSQGPCMVIEDSGPGIPESEREKIFERFYRLPGADNQGSGLGLSIVEAVVQVHGGRISLTAPEERSGLIVTVCYPKPNHTPGPNTN
jgi:two-component system sensor histidine kinase QseC